MQPDPESKGRTINLDIKMALFQLTKQDGVRSRPYQKFL